MDFSWATDTGFLLYAISTLDIVVVAYLIYRILLLIRGTRAEQILVGLAFIVLAFFVSRLLGLKTLSWILDNFTSSFVLIVIIVFQDNIRNGLSGVRWGWLFGTGTKTQGLRLVDKLSRAVEAMAREKIGAIIVVEREGDLSKLEETGFPLDSEISTELMMQIFTPPGPLHDGALLVQHGRLTRAGVWLPLTRNPRIARSMGSRHRAALGITETMDAIALVVSEERGQVSVCEGGVLTRDLNSEMLRKILQRHLGGGAAAPAKPSPTPSVEE